MSAVRCHNLKGNVNLLCSTSERARGCAIDPIAGSDILSCDVDKRRTEVSSMPLFYVEYNMTFFACSSCNVSQELRHLTMHDARSDCFNDVNTCIDSSTSVSRL